MTCRPLMVSVCTSTEAVRMVAFWAVRRLFWGIFATPFAGHGSAPCLGSPPTLGPAIFPTKMPGWSVRVILGALSMVASEPLVEFIPLGSSE
ncbi:hypothetical protein GCM10017750_13550 [Streptomyces racemochromogenes]